MKNRIYATKCWCAAGLILAIPPLAGMAAPSTNPGYKQANLVADTSGPAAQVDSRLVNAWGIVAGPAGVWVNDNETGFTTAYNPAGHSSKMAITIPAPGGGQGKPSGLVFNNTAQFVISSGSKSGPSTFLMATEDGTITAWNQSAGSSAMIVVDNSGAGAVYKGLAIARTASGDPQIYAANFHVGKVDVFDGQFHSVTSFTDSSLPPLFAPFNVRAIHGRLFVTFAKQKLPDAEDDEAGPGNGFVDVFDTDGTLLRRFASQGPLNSPWGLAEAPARFGKFSHALLIGNFGDGRINAYDLLTGKLLGNLTNPDGSDLVIDGLWGLTFEREPKLDHECDFDARRLYFSAGPNDESNGLLGFLQPVSPFVTPAR